MLSILAENMGNLSDMVDLYLRQEVEGYSDSAAKSCSPQIMIMGRRSNVAGLEWSEAASAVTSLTSELGTDFSETVREQTYCLLGGRGQKPKGHGLVRILTT